MTALIEYSREIGPLVRQIDTKKQIIKDFKETDETAQNLAQYVKDAQEALKAHVEKENDDILKEIKELETELKEAVKAAARSTKGTDREFTSGELTPYFKARNKPVEMGKVKPVKKVIDKGETFEELEDKIGSE
jgi:cell division septum initiation protein DivIVA